MKNLRQFQTFDVARFLKDKTLMYINNEPYYSYVDGKRTDNVEGTKYNLVISSDNTNYEKGETHDNEFEKLSIKVPGAPQGQIEHHASVMPIGIIKATVYGDYSNQLSITAEHVFTADQYKQWAKAQQ